MQREQSSPLRFDGRVALVTGAGQGLGRAYATLLAQRGAKVVVNDLGTGADGTTSDPARARAVVDEIQGAGGEAVANGSSVATPEGAAEMVGAALDAFGRIDIIINNAGLFAVTPVPDVTPADLQRQLDVHVHGPLNVCQAAWPHLVQQGYGRIVVTSSTAIYGSIRSVAYSAAKGGAYGLARALATAGAEHGITVNAFGPTAFTPLTRASRGVAADPVDARVNDLMTEDRVAPAVIALVHESNTRSGRFYLAGGGRIVRAFLAETPGWFTEDPTPEDVTEHWADIDAEPGYDIPTDLETQRVRTRGLVYEGHGGAVEA